jgi:prepilin-type N-terminal cleavage/methylation domain-containing protein
MTAQPGIPDNKRRGFSVTELLVVIAIIAILVTLLLVALGGARAKAQSLRATATMTEFAKACDTFQLDHGRYPGPVPEDALPAASPVTGMELALLEMMGGVNAFHPTLAKDTSGNYANYGGTQINLANSWEIKVDLSLLGDGTLVGGKPYAPYYAPSPNELAPAAGQLNATMEIPDLIDPWGQPILYLRRARENGPMVAAPGTLARFTTAGILPYVQSTALGEFAFDQTSLSILNQAPSFEDTLAQLLRSPAFGDANMPQAGTPRGAVAVMSAGPDGIYFSVNDGPGSSGSPVLDIVSDPATNDPKAIAEYDDIRVFTGG